jgi:hypothetical protein
MPARKSDIVLGRKYRDKITGLEGTADATSPPGELICRSIVFTREAVQSRS